MTIIVTTAPTTEPVTLAEAKTHCRVDHASDDAYLTALISAARESCEHLTNRALAAQTREVVLDAFPVAVELTGGSVSSVTSVKYFDEAGVQQTLAAQDYAVDADSLPGYVMPAYGKSWPATQAVPNAVRVRYVCGYTAAPLAIKQWILMRVASMYENRADVATSREAAATVSPFVDSLLDPYRVPVL